MARALCAGLGWRAGAVPVPNDAEAVYLSGYFEAQILPEWPGVPVAAYFTHREEEPKGNAKAKLFDQVAGKVDMRIATCRLYAESLERIGPTAQVAAPLERDRFVIVERGRRSRPVVGLSGYTYANHRKGEDLVKAMIESPVGASVEWRASGRGWPVPTTRYQWADMPGYYQGLDVLVCPSRVEGIPMPTLEALSCGVQVVIPRGVGLHDELLEVPGIWRYDRGNVRSLLKALQAAVDTVDTVDREALREATAPHSVEAWCRDVGAAVGSMAHVAEPVDAGMAQETAAEAMPVRIETVAPVARGTGSKRGIYCVAFGDPARACALRMMQSAKKHMPDIPIALVAAERLGVEDVFIQQPDSDIGGRRAKLRAYELAPAEWETVLYLDADTEVTAPIYRFFEWVEDGWELVITKDPHLMDTMHSYERRNNKRELAATAEALGTLHTLQWNGGVWAFGRNERVARFFGRWQAEWEVHAQRDQGPLVRAMYAEPLRVWTLGSEWNTFEKYSKGITTAGLMHYPGDARRWKGMIPGRIDSPEAWDAVKRYQERAG